MRKNRNDGDKSIIVTVSASVISWSGQQARGGPLGHLASYVKLHSMVTCKFQKFSDKVEVESGDGGLPTRTEYAGLF